MTATSIQPAAMREELLHTISGAIDRHPRTLQTAIGPSEIGTPCPRRLGHKLNNTPPARTQPAAWRPTVGTATHEWLANAFRADNARYAPDVRWLVELPVRVGEIDGQVIWGNADLYDMHMQWVIDWKIVGPTSMKRYRADIAKDRCPDETYRSQLHLYGRGFARGDVQFAVEQVAIVFLPSAGELSDALIWHEPWNEQLAVDALARADGIAAGLRLVGPDLILPQLGTYDAHCGHCSWWRPGATDLTKACPGAESMLAKPLAMPDLVTS